MLPDNLLPCNSKIHQNYKSPTSMCLISRLNLGTWSTCMISENHTWTSVWQNSHITSRAQLKQDSWDTSLRFGRVSDLTVSYLENIKVFFPSTIKYQLYLTSACRFFFQSDEFPQTLYLCLNTVLCIILYIRYISVQHGMNRLSTLALSL